jgi:hypothetical protein
VTGTHIPCTGNLAHGGSGRGHGHGLAVTQCLRQWQADVGARQATEGRWLTLSTTEPACRARPASGIRVHWQVCTAAGGRGNTRAVGRRTHGLPSCRLGYGVRVQVTAVWVRLVGNDFFILGPGDYKKKGQ